MKIAIPVEEKNIEANVSTFFGRTKYFAIYTIETKGIEYIENEGKNASGGAGIKSAQTIIDKKVDILITTKLGENAIETLKEGKIDIYEAKDISVENNIKCLLKKELNKIEA